MYQEFTGSKVPTVFKNVLKSVEAMVSELNKYYDNKVQEISDQKEMENNVFDKN